MKSKIFTLFLLLIATFLFRGQTVMGQCTLEKEFGFAPFVNGGITVSEGAMVNMVLGGTFNSCGVTTTNGGWIGNGDLYSLYTLDFSGATNNISYLLTATNTGEVFTITPNAGSVTITILSSTCPADWSIVGNTITNIGGATGGVQILATSTSDFTSLAIEYSGTGNGSYMTTCFDLMGPGAPSCSATTPNGGTNQELCNATTATLVGNAPASGETASWSYVSGGVVAPTVVPGTGSVANVTFNDGNPPTGDYTYTFRYLITDGTPGCANNYTDITITNYRPPFTPYAGPDQDICFATNPVNVTMAADAVGYGTGTWSQVAGPAFSIPVIDLNNPTAVFALTAPGQYGFVWTTTNGVCTPATDNVDIRVWEPVTADAGPDQDICWGTMSITMAGVTSGDVSQVFWSTSGDGYFDNPFDPNAEYFLGSNDIDAMIAYGTVTLSFAVDGTSPCGSETDDMIFRLETIDPVITNCLPASYTVYTDVDCSITVPDLTADVTYTDNCPDPSTVNQSPAAGTIIPSFHGDAITVTMTVTDYVGNISLPCTKTLNVVDNIAPVVTCPADLTQSNDLGDCGAVVTFTPTATDNCNVASLIASPASGTYFIVGTTTVTVTATDDAGLTDVCTFDVTVVDDEAPVISCPTGGDINLDASCQIAIPDVTGGVTATDNCAVATVVQSPLPGSYASSHDQVHVVTVTVTDIHSNVSTCTVSFTAKDVDAPVITTCPADRDVNLTDGIFSVTDATFTDEGLYTAALTTGGLGYNVEDFNTFVWGNPISTPWALVQGGVTTTFNTSVSTLWQNNGALSTENAGSTLNATFSGDPVYGFGGWFTGTDNPGNFITATISLTDGGSFNFTFVPASSTDFVGFTFATPISGFTLDATGGLDWPQIDHFYTATGVPGCSLVVPDLVTGFVDATDNCTWTASQSPAAGTILASADGMTHNVTFTVTDGAGLTDNCTVILTGQDVTAPVISTCPADRNVSIDATAGCTLTIPDLVPEVVADDNCTVASITQNPVAASVLATAHGTTHVVTITVTDLAGNITTCEVTLTAVDDTYPVITNCVTNIAQDNDAGDCGAIVYYGVDPFIPWGDITATDNCVTTFTLLSGYYNGDFFPVGTTTVTWEVADDAGNAVTCSFDVVITDAEPPVIICPPDITANNDPGDCFAIIDIDTPYNTDNCAVDYVTNDAPATYPAGNPATTVVTWTAVDIHGNVSTCTQNIIVYDVEAPIITTCPADRDVNINTNSGCEITIPALVSEVVATENCVIASISQLPAAGDVVATAHNATTTVTITVADINGNSTTCVVTLTAKDITAPNAFCANYTAELDITGNVSITPANVDDGSWDNCGIVSWNVSPSSFTCNELGANTVTLTLEDAAGNISTCTSTVTVVDYIAPDAVCVPFTAYLDATGNVTIAATDVDGGSTDNCTIASMVVSPDAFTCTELGANLVTLYVTDQSGNVGTCQTTVTVVDEIAPNAVCQAYTAVLDATGNVSITAANVNGGSSDNCTIASMLVAPDAFTCADLGDNDVVLTVTDQSGNVATCVAVVTVVDNMAPTTLCKDITVYLDGNGEADITPMMIDNGSYDNCSIVNYALDVTHFECDVDLGPNPVILTVTDQSGNSETCSATVTVVDNIPPVITCPANVLTCSLPDESLDYTPVYDINPTITDNCSFTYSYTTSGATTISGTGDASGRDFNVGITTVLYTVIDAGGNVSTCAFDIEVIEYQAADAGPAVLEACNTEFVLLLGNIPTPGTSLWYQDMTTGAPAATITQVLNEAYADDLVAGYTYKFVYQIDNGPCTSDDTITYNNWLPASASLAGFDQELCNATSFTLAGNTPAVGQGTWIQISGPSCTFTDVNNPAMEVTGVTPGQYAFVWQIVNGPVCPPENDEVLITVYPMVTVDAGADDIVCPNAGYYEVTGATAANYSSLFWQATGTGYFDNVTVTNPKYYFSSDDIALGSVTLMLHGYGLGPCPDVLNEMVLTINDFTPPVIATCAPAQDVNLNATCGLVVPDLTAAVVATDNCNDIVITQSPAAGSVLASAHNQTHVVTITVTDIRNNTATCMVTLTGLDVTAPVISVCAPAQNVDLNATCQVVVPNLLPAVTASDNCTYTLTQSPVAGTALASAHNSTHTVVITATDAAGLTATCSVVLTAKDVTAPVITVCPAPQNVNLSGSCSITVPNLVALTSATDNCTYTITQAPAATTILASAHNQVHNVTISATDAAGNVTTCVVALTAKDVTNPAFTGCPANITVNNTPGQCGATVSWTAPTPTDNCVGVTSVQTAGLASGSFFPYGTTTITYTATDLAGLTAVCTFTVTVNDNQNPTIGCVASVVQDNDPGVCTAVVTGIDPVNPWDNCPGYVVTYVLTGVTTGSGTGTASGTTFNKGVTTVTYTITDHVGRTANCSFTVTIEDNEGPAITCPELAIYDNTPGMCVGIGLVLDAPVVTDNCSEIPSITVTNNAPAIYVLGNNYVTWTATDLEGNVTTCVQVVQVIDTEVPTITCPANITVNAGDPIDLGMPVTDDNCWVASIANNAPVTFPVGVTTVTWTVTDGVFNTATCTQTVTVVDPLAPVYTLGGRFSYANTVGSPMNNAPVALKENGTVVATTVTDANGEYQFTAVEPGTYTVEGASTTEWGGANATDALLVMKHFTQVITLVGLPKDAGDVNANGFINSLDALLIAKRFVSQITSFPSGDWTADAPVVELNSNTITDFNALCMGDVNASYVPSTKSEPTVSMNVEGVKYITANETFELPVYTNHSLNTGAISMVINYASDIFDVVGVRIADVDGGNLVYSALNNEIRIAWFNNVPAVFNSNEAVVILSLRAKSEGDATFTLDGISEIANANAQVEYAALTMPKVAFTSNAFAVNVYPNPFKHNTEFTYTLPTDSKVSLVVYDILGNEVASILNGVEQTANTYKLTFDASNLKQGVYTYKLMVGNQTKVGRLVINR